MATETVQNANATAPSVFTPEKVQAVSRALNAMLADLFTLYIKTKNFHWHMNGRHFRDYHLLLDEQATQIFAITDDVAERVRKIGGTTLRSIGDIKKLQRIRDSEEDVISAEKMLQELYHDNRALVAAMRDAHEITDEADDFATTSMIEIWIDEAERRAWFLFETIREFER